MLVRYSFRGWWTVKRYGTLFCAMKLDEGGAILGGGDLHGGRRSSLLVELRLPRHYLERWKRPWTYGMAHNLESTFHRVKCQKSMGMKGNPT